MTECACKDKTGPGHDTGPVLCIYETTWGTEMDLADCLAESVRSAARRYCHDDHTYRPGVFAGSDGSLISEEVWGPMFKAAVSAIYQEDRAARAEAKDEPLYRTTASHPDAPGQVFDFGVSSRIESTYAPAASLSDDLAPFGFVVKQTEYTRTGFSNDPT